MSLARDMELWRALVMLDVLPLPMVRDVMAAIYPPGREAFSPPAVNPIDYIAERGLMPLGGPWGTILAAIYKGRSWRFSELEKQYPDAMIISLHGHWVSIDEDLVQLIGSGDAAAADIVIRDIKSLIRDANEQGRKP